MDNVINRSLSESELQSTPPNYVCTTRNKRPREDDYRTDLVDFKQEMKNMITSLFCEQEKELHKISSMQREIQQSSCNIENSVAFLTAQNDELRKKIEILERRSTEDKNYILVLENRIEDIQREIRKSNLEIKNVPKLKTETKEDLIEMVINLSNNVDGSITKSDIKDVYRVHGRKENMNSPPIIVETSSALTKVELLKKCKNFNVKHKNKLCAKHVGLRVAEETPIFVSEQLTPKGARLFFLARDLAKTKTLRFCWTAYGKVFVRKNENSPIIKITCEAQVQELMQKM